MDCRKSSHLNSVENAQDVELSLLRQIGGIGEDGKRNVHCQKVAERG
jgi:hypothetical protein